MQQLPGLDFQLGEDIESLRDTVHAFAQSEIAPHAVLSGQLIPTGSGVSRRRGLRSSAQAASAAR